MPTVCLRFRFEEHPKIRALMEACADIQRQAVDYSLVEREAGGEWECPCGRFRLQWEIP